MEAIVRFGITPRKRGRLTKDFYMDCRQGNYPASFPATSGIVPAAFCTTRMTSTWSTLKPRQFTMFRMVNPAAKTTILLLVSDPLVRAVTQETLQQAGYTVLAARDLGAAVDWIRDIPPDLLITRLYVDNLPGHQAAKYLRTKRPGMRVLIMSGLLDDDRLATREMLDGFEIFPQPYKTSEFLERVREVLASSHSPKTAHSAL
jgi:CheY-like chemotaxis protein